MRRLSGRGRWGGARRRPRRRSLGGAILHTICAPKNSTRAEPTTCATQPRPCLARREGPGAARAPPLYTSASSSYRPRRNFGAGLAPLDRDGDDVADAPALAGLVDDLGELGARVVGHLRRAAGGVRCERCGGGGGGGGGGVRFCLAGTCALSRSLSHTRTFKKVPLPIMCLTSGSGGGGRGVARVGREERGVCVRPEAPRFCVCSLAFTSSLSSRPSQQP